MDEIENTGYRDEMAEAQSIDKRFTSRTETIVEVISQQIIGLHNKSHDSTDIDKLIRVAQMIDALSGDYHIFTS